MAPSQGTATAPQVAKAPEPAPAAFGAFLREHREARHLTIKQIAEITKIASHHFHALERGDIRRWPGGMYRRAMFRAYAQAIGLDAEETVRTFLEVFSEEPPDAASDASRATAQATVQTSDVGRRAASAARIVGAAAALLFMGWYAASYIRGVIRSDRVSTPPPVPAEAKATLELQPALEPVVDTQATLTATVGTASKNVSSPAPAAAPIEGELSVQSDPDGAQVTINGIGWGRTPVTVKYLPFGEKRVRLTKDGYVSAERRIQITAERPVRPLRVTLQPR
jgi:cytoskeleton protein RodZ